MCIVKMFACVMCRFEHVQCPDFSMIDVKTFAFLLFSVMHMLFALLRITARIGLAALRLARLVRFGSVQCLMRNTLSMFHAQNMMHRMLGLFLPYVSNHGSLREESNESFMPVTIHLQFIGQDLFQMSFRIITYIDSIAC